MVTPKGFIETIRKHRGVWLYLDEHILRAVDSANQFGWSWKLDWDLNWLKSLCEEYIIGEEKEGLIRMVFTSKGEGYSKEIDVTLEIIGAIPQTGVHPNHSESWEAIKIRVGKNMAIRTSIYRIEQKAISDSSFIKELDSEFYNRARACVQKDEIDDQIILNSRGLVAETTIANLIFELPNGELICPGLNQGAVRGTCLEYLKKQLNISERPVQPEQLTFFSNIYRCNAVRGIQRIKLVN